MKRAMSLLLALAMVMSFFTVGAFAEGETLTVSPTTDSIIAGGSTELTAAATYTKSDAKGENDVLKFSYAEAYTWTVKKVAAEGDPVDSTDLTVTKGTGDNKNKATVVAKSTAEGEYIVTCAVAVTVSKTSAATADDDEPKAPTIPDAPVTITVVADNNEMKLVAREGETVPTAAQTMKLAPKGTGTLTLDAKLWSKAVEGGADAAEITTGVTYTLKSDKTSVATVSGTTVTAVAKGSANIVVEAEYMGKTYSKTICKVTVDDLGIEKTMPNGSYVTYPADSATNTTSIADAIAADLKAATGASEAPTVSAVKLTVPATSIFTAYNGEKKDADKLASGEKTIDLSKALIIAATAGSVGTENWTYKATVGETEYEGTLALKSDYASTVTDYQTADFTKEWFFLDSVGNSIVYIRDYVTGATTYPTDPVKVTEHKIYPSTHSTDWTENLIGYDNNKVAYLVDVKFVMAIYDVLTYAEDGEYPFSIDDFQAFAENVAYEQDDYYDVDVEYVKFTKAIETNDWELKKGSSRLSTSSKLTATELEAVYIDVKSAGICYIPFTVYFDYKNTSSSSWTTASKTYDGIICVYATAEGDIKYDVSYSDSVTFDTADFQSFYKTASGVSSAKLSRVVFDGLPLYGDLYTLPNKYTSGYLVDSSDVFYAEPSTSQNDLADVTYWAESTPKTEYSVYIPFTAYGNRTSQSGIVEIVVNGALPFTDVKETHTFYPYIKYVYDNNIMNGKTTTKFDASSSVTRIQLVTTLYRMAGSPTTYNRKTLAFTDTTKLSTEFTNALKWAVNTEIVNGYGNVFKPNDAVTRQAMVTILYRYANKEGFDTTTISNNNLAAYKDAAKVSASMKEAMNWAVDCGFVSGTTGKMLNPAGSTTRGACAKILATFHDWYIG